MADQAQCQDAVQQSTSELSGLLADFEPEGRLSLRALTVFKSAIPFLEEFDQSKIATLEKLCRYINWSLDQDKPEYSYVACGFLKEHVINWVKHLKTLVTCCLTCMTKLKPELVSDSKYLSIFLRTIVSLTSPSVWKIIKMEQYNSLANGMNKFANVLFSHLISEGNLFSNMHVILEAGLTRPGKIGFNRSNLYALVTLSNRALLEPTFSSEECVVQFITNILTVPAYIYFVNQLCPEGIELELFPIIVNFLGEEQNLDKCTSGKDLSYVVAILANLVQMGEHHSELKDMFHPVFVKVISKLLVKCGNKSNNSRKSHWHPILGWVAAPIPATFLNAATAVKSQIEALWGPVYLQALFCPLFEHLQLNPAHAVDKVNGSSPGQCEFEDKSTATNSKSGFVKFVRKIMQMDHSRRRTPTAPTVKFNSEVTVRVAYACNLYNSLISTFSLCRLDILTGLCFKESSYLLPRLWIFLQNLGTESCLRGWVEILLLKPAPVQAAIILMFSDAMIHFITILDDQEMYDEQKVFSLGAIAEIAYFVNNLCFRLISDAHYSNVEVSTWLSLKTFLMILYRRDSRRKFCPDEHWIIDHYKTSQLINDIEKGRKHAKRILLDMPHVLREESRVILFRKWATSEKTINGCTLGDHDVFTSGTGSTLITIQRGRIVEDGYANLANLSTKALKGTIRVRFQNELGLDEAGIDQDGVFKEFLEETINAVFSPSLNLFKSTSENRLYPSSLSYLHENHLELFEFVGKMLGKAVYEGIVVDVHFAPFFLSQMLGLQQNALLFSVIDEIQSLDRELYNSLTYIKHYDGNVKDLELTFSVDEDVLGELRTTELVPGGRNIQVTNENKISYLYLKAHFHLYVQIKEQTHAFLKGFRTIIPNEWLNIFSPPELQRLIGGEDSDIDLADLRRNTQYYGGFHDNHRVIVWLWEILENEFNEHERRLFLKFATSCSKPPLLGFMNLDPSFSIRCVEVSDDDDTGDTIGSVLRGFLTLGKREPVGRLPTSSTCFNLLKLPNYGKKATLRDKLRYAITSNVGFELS